MAKSPKQEHKKPEIETEVGIVRANINREVTPGPGFVSLYANDTQIQVTPWDIRLIFGEISSVVAAGQASIAVKLTGEVRMSPQHAKKLLAVLQGQIELYEKMIGPIPMPREGTPSVPST